MKTWFFFLSHCTFLAYHFPHFGICFIREGKVRIEDIHFAIQGAAFQLEVKSQVAEHTVQTSYEFDEEIHDHQTQNRDSLESTALKIP